MAQQHLPLPEGLQTTPPLYDDVRRRFLSWKGMRSMQEIAQELEPLRTCQTLARFCRGHFVSRSTLQAIEQWIIAEETRGAAARKPTQGA